MLPSEKVKPNSVFFFFPTFHLIFFFFKLALQVQHFPKAEFDQEEIPVKSQHFSETQEAIRHS